MSTFQARVSAVIVLFSAYLIVNWKALALGATPPGKAVQLLCYGVVILIVLLAPRLRPAGTRRLKRDLIALALVAGFVQVVWLVLAGSVTGFGLSPFDISASGALTVLLRVGLALIAVEFARAYLVSGRRADQMWVIVLATLLFTWLQLPLARLVHLSDVQGMVEFIGAQGLPLLAENLLATLLVFLGGPLPAILYRAVLAGFEYFSPVLPDISWGLKALIGTTVPGLAFLLVEMMATGRVRGERALPRPRGGSSSLALGSGAVVGVLALWFVLRLLPFHATAVAGGSMRPEFDYGDLIIAVETAAENIEEGDIIEFVSDGSAIVHRVVAVEQHGETRMFVTKGDANEDADPYPIPADDLRGRIVWSIPRAGWVAITFRD